MKLFNCYHPKVVTNPYTKESIVVRCGKCPACLNARSASWVQRLDNEFMQHPFTLFVTFQYDEQHVPQLVRLRHEDWSNNLPCYIDSSTGVIVDLASVPNLSQPDILYCYDTKVLLVHNYSDFQLFLKRIRKYISEHYENARIRYFAAFEYGPTTFRPHIHSLFFFDSPSLAQDFSRILSEFWQFGAVFDPHFVDSSVAQYVASYLNCTTSLPKIYLHPYIKQKALFSKCPPIGSYSWTEKTYREFFFSQSPKITLFRKNVSQFCDVPLWRSLQSRLYPKFTGFDKLFHYDRVLLYRKGFDLIDKRLTREQLKLDLQSPFWLPFFEYAFKHKVLKHFEFNELAFSRFIGVIIRVCKNCISFGVDIEDYVSRIEDFYDKKQKSDLAEFYYLQMKYFESHPVSDFLMFNTNFCVEVYNKPYNKLSSWLRFYLDLYMPNKFKDGDLVKIVYQDSFAYNELIKLHNKISFDNTKQKKANDYVLAHKDKFNNIITYNQNIESYVKSEII